ncbi:hypothetical protein LJC00_01325 [Dysgonomonas sp. OttesenSCG-928-M03]|nr:hypothetical protein [Dysgonomonas sp. OttesenSCG-928-M03]
MKIYLYYVTFILLGILLLCCNKRKEQSYTVSNDKVEEASVKENIISITALYYNYVFRGEYIVNQSDIRKDIPRFGINRKGVLDAEINDSVKLAKIYLLIASLKPSQDIIPLDARIVATINYSNGVKDTLCIGGEYSDQIFLNGTRMETNNELLFTVKNYIGFYPWIIGDDMFRMTEMKDNSFAKEPFVSSAYYKEYQLVMNE